MRLARIAIPVLVAAAAAPDGVARTPAPASLAMALPGPSTLCEPIAIGKARSLPWKGENWNAADDLAPARVRPLTMEILSTSDDALVHMETIRRAAIYLSGMGRGQDKPAGAPKLAAALVDAMRARIATEELEEENVRRQALAWFDLGYALAAFEQAGLRTGPGTRKAIERAAELQPDDGAIHLGAALATWTREGGRKERRMHFRRAAELSRDPETLLRTNLLACAEHFLEVSTYDQLLDKLRT